MIPIGTSRLRLAAVVLIASALGALASVPFAIWYDGYPALAVVPAILVPGAVASLLAEHGRRRERERDRARSTAGAIVSATPEAVVQVDREGVVRAWDDDGDVLGEPVAERVGRPLTEIARDEEARSSLEEILAAVANGETAAEGQLVHPRPDGTLRPVRVSAAPVFASGRPDGAAVILADDERTQEWERRARDVQARYEAVSDHVPGITYEHPPGRRAAPVRVSRQVEALLGYSADECVGRPLLLGDAIHPEDRARVEEELATAGADEFRSEYRLLARSGRVVDVADVAVTIRGDDGEPVAVQGVLWDVSDRRRSEEERERLAGRAEALNAGATLRQERLDLLTEASRLLVSSAETRERLERMAVLAVRAFADWCTIDLVDDEGTAHREIVVHGDPRPPSATDPAPDVDEDALDVGKTGRARLEPDRILVPLVSRGRTVGVLTFLVTAPGREYGAAELAVAEHMARIAGLVVDLGRLRQEVQEGAEAARVLAYVGDGVMLVDRAGVVRLWNPAAEAITGRPADAVVGKPVTEAIPRWGDLAERIPVTSTPEQAQPDTLPIEAENGERWISIAGVQFFGGIVYAFRDVTEAHRLDELKAEFVATASHELRTPLAAVYGAAQTLRRHDFALDESGRERFVALIVDESDRLSRIVNEILLANQLDVGRLDLHTEPFDGADLVDRVVESFRTHAPGVELRIDASPNLPLVAADRDKARQVLVNLIENAIKYSPEGGDIEVRVAAGATTVTFSVADKGLGIPAEEQARIFEKFYRLDPSMARGVGGTGLGLYICRELVERMGGQIFVESVAGSGSTFSFELPRAEAGAPRPSAAERAASADGDGSSIVRARPATAS